MHRLPFEKRYTHLLRHVSVNHPFAVSLSLSYRFIFDCCETWEEMGVGKERYERNEKNEMTRGEARGGANGGANGGGRFLNYF